jgi:fucose permease
LAFLNGPRSYLKKLTAKKNMVATSVLFGSMVLSLYFSLIESSYLLSLVFCIVEFNAIALFFCNSFPMGTQGIKFIGSSAGKVLAAPFRN